MMYNKDAPPAAPSDTPVNTRRRQFLKSGALGSGFVVLAPYIFRAPPRTPECR